MRRLSFLSWMAVVTAATLAPSWGRADFYQQTNLVSDLPHVAIHQDPNLVNPWGIAFGPTGPFWISDNGAGVATLYNSLGKQVPLIVTIPPASGASPTGQVFSSSATDFLVDGTHPARFIFATEGGTISAWNPQANLTNAILTVDNSASGSVYKGLAIGTSGGSSFLYASDFHNGQIHVFNSSFQQSMSGAFQDPNLPSGYAPFNVQNLNGKIYVTYALQDATGHDDVPGPGHGFVDVYDTAGNLLQRLISGGVLNSPWGLAVAPSHWGAFSNDLLVGNFGDGRINAFDPTTGAFVGTLTDAFGNPIEIDGLWALVFGHAGSNGRPDQLFFTAGLNDEADGLFGKIQSVPEPGSATLILLGAGALGLGYYRRRMRSAA